MPRRIDKRLFEAGNQCAKRLHLEVIESGANDDRQALSELGQRIVELARQAFPRGQQVDTEDFARAVAQTRELLGQPGPQILFDACFQGPETEIHTDIVIATGDGNLDVFEVKAGTTVKQRHLFDVALQVYTIESAGWNVKGTSVLHLDPRYRHGGGQNLPVQRLFRNVDVTARVRRLIDRVAHRVEKLLAQLDDDSALDLPTGTWCRHPLPCRFLASCVAAGPDNPLVFLPELTHQQETRFHEAAIEDISQIAEDHDGLSVTQRRALKSVHEGTPQIEKFVLDELQNIEYPIHFLHVQWHMEVLPTFENQRPWQKLPFQWSIVSRDADGTTAEICYACTDAEDPRQPCTSSLSEQASKAGTVITYQPEFDRRIRALLDDNPSLKGDVRVLLNVPLLNLSELIRRGAYAPGFQGTFDLAPVYHALTGNELFKGLEIRTDQAASEAIRRMLNSRTRAKTREKLGGQLNDYGNRIARGIADVFQAIRDFKPSE